MKRGLGGAAWILTVRESTRLLFRWEERVVEMAFLVCAWLPIMGTSVRRQSYAPCGVMQWLEMEVEVERSCLLLRARDVRVPWYCRVIGFQPWWGSGSMGETF
ncbi:hypothetical protein L484_018491 [Morus notabilis]|uniref:Uncharacterized protein n=1 Tax=Morus notabilis TaxID=981085 RepID=W9S3I0_9ROSA|nr:hypothetical protein L484_018491 [Morus notabilis]